MKLATQTIEILDDEFQSRGNHVFTSLEGHQPGASIKDHLVLGELEMLLKSGKIRTGQLVSEMSAGSTAFSLAHHCQILGLRCAIFVPDTLDSDHIKRLARRAEVHPVPLNEAMERYEEFCHNNSVHPLNQLNDSNKRRHYFPMAAEIQKQLGPIDLVLGAVGTGHSLQGLGIALGAKTLTAEPLGFQVPGVRNLEEVRWGEKDPCIPSLFNERIIVTKDEYDDTPTALGEMVYSDSFRLILAACRKKLLNPAGEAPEGKKIFLVGARNRLNQAY